MGCRGEGLGEVKREGWDGRVIFSMYCFHYVLHFIIRNETSS